MGVRCGDILGTVFGRCVYPFSLGSVLCFFFKKKSTIIASTKKKDNVKLIVQNASGTQAWCGDGRRCVVRSGRVPHEREGVH